MQGYFPDETFAELWVSRKLGLERQNEIFHNPWCLGDKFLLERRPAKIN